MAESKRKPQRRCCACMTVREKKDLMRIVRTPEGGVLLDEGGRANGRGAYLCRSIACLETARKRRGLERTLKHAVDPLLYELLKEKIEKHNG